MNDRPFRHRMAYVQTSEIPNSVAVHLAYFSEVQPKEFREFGLVHSVGDPSLGAWEEHFSVGRSLNFTRSLGSA